MRAMNRLVTALVGFVAIAAFAPRADAAVPKKKYHFELTKVLAKPEVKPDVAKTAQPRVEAQIKKKFEDHPQLVGTLDGAPDPAANADAYRKFLIKKGIAGSYLVTVEITDASEELVPLEGKPNSQRLVIHVGLHLLGETIPGRTMGFTGDGQATIKQEVGLKMRDKDRDYTWDGAVETAIDDALKTCFEQLSKSQSKH